MNRIAKLLSLFSLLTGAVGCVSSYKHVMVTVVDATTGSPVSGARVETSYPLGSPWFQFFRRPSSAVTDTNGNALVSAYYNRRRPVLFWSSDDEPDPFYQALITNETYRDGSSDCAHFNTLEMLLDRTAKFIPSAPDIVLKVTSESEKARRAVEREKERRVEEQTAEDLFRNQPDFWPEHKWKDDQHLPVPNRMGGILVSKRWESAAKVCLGAPSDTNVIQTVVMRAMHDARADVYVSFKVYEIRWLLPSVVMVCSGRSMGPGNEETFFYVLKKENDQWKMLAYYLESIT